MKFEITEEEQAKIDKWLEEVVYPPIIEAQLKDPRHAAMLFADDNGKIKYPYFGAIGGDLTYKFTPTSLGTVLVVESCGQELNLTDYGSW